MKDQWIKWIQASIFKHFDDNKGSLAIHFEGNDFPKKNNTSLIEVRTTVPLISEQSRGWYNADVLVSILVHTVMNGNLYTVDDNIGTVLAAFTNIPVKKYGGGDESMFTCLSLVPGIRIQKFGQVDPDEKLLMSMIEGNYTATFEG